MATTMTTPEKNSKKSGNKLLHRTVTICVILLLLLCVGLFFWHNKNATASDNRLEDSVAAQLGQLEGKSEAEIQEELNRVVEEGTMAISINVNPVFDSGDSEGTLEIENAPGNKYAQVVSITLDDSGKEIYNSGLIQPNYHIQTDKLSAALAAPLPSRLMIPPMPRILSRLALLLPRLRFLCCLNDSPRCRLRFAPGLFGNL